MLRALMTRILRRIAPSFSPLTLALVMSVVVLAASACSRRIGNECKLSTDCSLQGERICDLSYLTVDSEGMQKGECIIEGCSAGSCPSEAVCVNIYSTEFLSVACDPEREDRSDGLDDCNANEICIPEGLCADANTARATCRKECKRDSGCRDGYSCKPTGKGGIYVSLDPEDPQGTEETKICMPSV